MTRRPVVQRRWALALLFVVLASVVARVQATTQEAFARVTFAGRPVPGAVVTATLGDRRVTTTSDADGVVRLTGLEPGSWTIQIDLFGFEIASPPGAAVTGSIPLVVPVAGPPPEWKLKLVSLDTVLRAVRPSAAPPQQATIVAQPREDATAATDGFLVNGSVNNAAASPFAQPRGFGNNRPQPASAYSGTLSIAGGTSRWDARPFSFGSTRLAQPSHLGVEISAAVGGPVKPWPRDRTAPRFFVAYQGSTRQTASTESLLVPTIRQRAGDFSGMLDAAGAPVAVTDPRTGAAFDHGVIPSDRLSAHAVALLRLYPLPSRDAADGANFDATVTSIVRQDDLQSRVTHSIGRNLLVGTVALQRATTRSITAFAFEDERRTTGRDALASWTHRFRPRLALRLRYQHTRVSAAVTPFFADRVNVSADAGIVGNDQTPDNWGPPRLVFPDFAALADAAFFHDETRTDAVNVETYLNRGRHTITVGADLRRMRRDVVSQQDARGTFTFTGTATGVPLADFLLGLPATSAIGAGNADKRFHSHSVVAYISDDARIRPTITLTLGVRWEYDAPFTERDGQLANLDIVPDFSAVRSVTSRDAVGALTARRYPSSLVRSDYSGVQPRVAAAWRPIAGSSMIVRAGYGLYRNASLYPSLAVALSEQPPFSRTVLAARSDAAPLTLADGFADVGDSSAGTFAVDPDVRVGFAQTWQVSIQRDLPASLFVMASYLGSQGRHLLQQILPNTVPPGAVNPCAECPRGFAYLTSHGRASRHALQLLLRRRLRGGFSASAQYTFGRAHDDASTFSGGVPPAGSVVQDWRNPRAEWSPSSFDQRHALAVDFQYTTGVGVRGGATLDGWAGALMRGWTVAGELAAGTGLPFTPVYLAVLPGTGFVGLRPDVTQAEQKPRTTGRYANADAFTAPVPGAWGNASRHSIRGPAQFRFDLSLARAFSWGDRRSVEWRVDALNVLNRVTFSRVHTTIGSSLFGQASAANPMRKIQMGLRVRF